MVRFAGERPLRRALGGLCLLGFLVASGTVRAQDNDLIPEPGRVSRGLFNLPTNQPSTEPSISLDGGTIVYTTMATNILPADRDRVLDLMAFDVEAGTTRLIGRPALQREKLDNHSPSVDGDGSRVAFVGDGVLVGGAAPDEPNVYLFEMDDDGISLVSVATNGVPDGPSTSPVISDNGNTVVFISSARNLVSPALGSRTARLHIRDLRRGRTTRLDGSQRVTGVDVSGDGRFSVFDSTGTSLDPTDGNGARDVFLYDRDTDTVTRVSIGTGRIEANDDSDNPRISSNARYIAYDSNATNLVRGDTNGLKDVFLHDRLTGRTTRISVDSDEEQLTFESTLDDIDQEGRNIAFTTRAVIHPTDFNRQVDVYIRDRLLEHTRIMGLTSGGFRTSGNGVSQNASMSGNGLGLAYESDSENFDGGADGNGFTDVYFSLFELPDFSLLPPHNGLLFSTGQVLRQIDPDGVVSGTTLGADVLGLAVDEANVAWVLSPGNLRRVEADSFDEIISPVANFPVATPGAPFYDMVAGHGFAFVAQGFTIEKIDTLGDKSSIFLGDIGGPLDHLAMALDPVGSLMVADYRGGTQTLTRYSLDFERLERSSFARTEGADEIAFDPSGNLFMRCADILEKRSPSLNGLWRIALDGQGLAVDGRGNVYTTTDAGQVLGFRPDGTRFFATSFPVQGTDDHRLALDGAGHIWLLRSGRGNLQRFRLSDGRRRSFSVDTLATQGPAARNGYVAANVFAREADADGEDILNGFETANETNPFDDSDPNTSDQAPPVLNPVARPVGADRVRLEWNSPVEYDRFVVFRDGRELPGSPFTFNAAATGFEDASAGGGPHVYQVRGETGGGGGGDGGDGGGAGVAGAGFDVQFSGGHGEGELLASAELAEAPQAIAVNRQDDVIFVSTGGRTLLTLDANLNVTGEEDLGGLLSFEAVRGLAVHPNNAARLFILTRESVFERSEAGVVKRFDVDSPSDEGFRSLTFRNNTLLMHAGPDIDCLIGRNQAGNPAGVANISEALGSQVVHTAGIAQLGSSVLLGVAPIGTSETTITRVYRMSLGDDFRLTPVGATVPLEAVDSDDIADFDYDPALGLVIADRGNRRVAIVRATFAGSIQLQSVTPPSAKWDQDTEIEVLGTGFGGREDVWLAIGGIDTPITNYQQNIGGGVSRIRALVGGQPSASATNVEVLGSNGPGGSFPGFIQGFDRGDSNNDAVLSLADGVHVLNFLFLGREDPDCKDAADVDDDGEITLQDAVRIFNFLFLGGAEPAPPFMTFGLDDDDSDSLGCGEDE